MPPLQKTIKKIITLTNGVELSDTPLNNEELSQVNAAIVDAARLQGDLEILQNNPEGAITACKSGLDFLSKLKNIELNTELGRLQCRLHYKLARFPIMLNVGAAEHAIQAIHWSANFIHHYLIELGKIVIITENPGNLAKQFYIELANAQITYYQALLSYFSSQPKTTSELLQCINSLCQIIRKEYPQVIHDKIEVIHLLSNVLERRLRRSDSGKFTVPQMATFVSNTLQLCDLLTEIGINLEQFPGLLAAYEQCLTAQPDFPAQ